MKGIAEDVIVYETPICRIVRVSFEGILCQSTITGGIIHEGIAGDDEPIN